MTAVSNPYIDSVVCRLYQRGWTIRKIAKEVALSPATTHRVLIRYGVPRMPVGAKRLHCVDCDSLTNGAKRCEIHRREHERELRQDWLERNPHWRRPPRRSKTR